MLPKKLVIKIIKGLHNFARELLSTAPFYYFYITKV